MGYVVYRKTDSGWKAVSRPFAKRSAAESRRHATAQHQPDWQLEVRLEPKASRELKAEH